MMVHVKRTADGDPAVFTVTVREGQGETTHVVTLSTSDRERYFAGHAPEEGIHAAFRFLLDREPKESILRRFDVSVISSYFPDFAGAIGGYLRGEG